jgi:drug/metabolite transporter (DMT)-like permease
MKKGLESYSPFQIASIRIIIAAVVLMPFAIRHLPLLNRSNILPVFVIGLSGSFIPSFLFPMAQTRIDSSLASMLNSLSPVFTLLFGIFLYNRKVIFSQFAGVFLGLVGALGLLYEGSFSFNVHGLLVVLATVLSGISSNEVGRVRSLNGLQITSLAFLLLSPFALTLLLFQLGNLQASVQTEHWIRNLGFIAILSIFGSAISIALCYRLIQETSPVFAAMTTYIIPVVATAWGLLDNEKFSFQMLFSMIIIFCGVYLINKPGLLKNLRKLID